MNEALAAWLEKLDNKILPVLQYSQDELTQLLRDENVPISRLAVIIEHDMGMALHLLRFINSISSKHLNSNINTVSHALMMLGLNQLRRLPQSLTTIESLNPSLQSLVRSFYSEAHHAAYQAGQWALIRKDYEPDEIYIAALLHNIGELMLWLFNTAEMSRLREMLQQDKMEKEQAEYVVLGFSIAEMTRELAKRWHLPELYCNSLYSENFDKPRVQGVMLAVQLARHSRRSWYSDDVGTIIEDVADYLYLDVDSTTALIHRFAAEAARRTPYIGSRPAVLNLLSEPPAAGTTTTPPPTTGQKSAQPGVGNKENASGSSFCLMTQLPLVQEALKYLAGNAGRLSVKEIITTTMHAMHDGLGLNRVVFALLTQHKTHLRPRSIVGVDNDPHFSKFSIALKSNNLFDRLMEKPQSLWLDDHNRNKFWKAVPTDFQRLIKVNRFYVMSVFVKGKPVGMFYVDRASNSCELDERCYKLFKQLVTQASVCLSKTTAKKNVSEG